MKKNETFVKKCALYLTLYSLLLGASFALINIFINKDIDKISKTLDDLLVYEHDIYNDDFDKIPLNRFKHNEIFIYDEDGHILYKTNNYEKLYLKFKDLEYIDDYSYNISYSMEKYKKDGSLNYIITKNKLSDDESESYILDYAVIDENYNVLSGTLFKDKKKLNKREFILLTSGMSGKSYVSKFTYNNKDGKKRVLVFYQKELSESAYLKKVNRIRRFWILIIPIFIIETAIIVVLFTKTLKNYLKLVNDQILNEDIDNEKEIPEEFQPYYRNIKKLINSLEEEKKERTLEENKRISIIANLSHDIKTPLSVINGYAKAFTDNMVPKDKTEKYMEAIYKKSMIASDIVSSLLIYSKMENVEFKANFEEADLTEFCREYLALKYTDLEMQGYKIDYDIDDKVFMASFDKSLMQRAFDNLINNSIYHNNKKIKLIFKTKVTNKKMSIIIGDNGCGIDEELKSKLFEPFVTSNKARTSGSGSGLGLSISKKIIDYHKGDIKYLDSKDKNLKFAIEITLYK